MWFFGCKHVVMRQEFLIWFFLPVSRTNSWLCKHNDLQVPLLIRKWRIFTNTKSEFYNLWFNGVCAIVVVVLLVGWVLFGLF